MKNIYAHFPVSNDLNQFVDQKLNGENFILYIDSIHEKIFDLIFPTRWERFLYIIILLTVVPEIIIEG